MSALVLRLPRAALARRDVVTRLAENEIARSLFAFECDELAFARAVLDAIATPRRRTSSRARVP
jgi:hypothetical protein